MTDVAIQPLQCYNSKVTQIEQANICKKCDSGSVKISAKLSTLPSAVRNDEQYFSKPSCRKSAFTMAEVLITLGIIGIIAAMTLPAVVGKYKFKAWEVGLKKQYSLLQNAINLAVNEEGIQQCYTYFPKGSVSYSGKTQDCDLLLNFLVSALKLKPYNDDIKAKYAKREVVRAQGGIAINWSCNYDNAVSRAKVYGANDGTIFMFFLKNVPAFVLIDVNGEQKPNKWGYDVFAMVLSNHNDYANPAPRILLTDEFCSIIEKGGRFPRAILRNQKVDTTKTWEYTW